MGIHGSNSGARLGEVSQLRNLQAPSSCVWDFCDDFDNGSDDWNTVTQISYDTVAEELDFNCDTNLGLAYKDALGSVLSDSLWVYQFKHRVDTFSATSGQIQKYWMGISSTIGDANGVQDFLGLVARIDSLGTKFQVVEGDGVTLANATVNDMTTVPSATTHYIRMKRLSATSFRVELYSDEYVTLVEGKTITVLSTIDTLRYPKFAVTSESAINNYVGADDEVRLEDATSTPPE